MKEKSMSISDHFNCEENFENLHIQISGEPDDDSGSFVGQDKGFGNVSSGDGQVRIVNSFGVVTVQAQLEVPEVSSEKTVLQADQKCRLVSEDHQNHLAGHVEGCGCSGKCATCTCRQNAKK